MSDDETDVPILVRCVVAAVVLALAVIIGSWLGTLLLLSDSRYQKETRDGDGPLRVVRQAQ